MHFSKRITVLIAVPVGIILALSAALIFLGTQIKSRVTEAKTVQSQFLYWLQAVESLSSLRKDYKKVEPYFNQVASLLPQQDELINFPKDIAAMGAVRKISASTNLGVESLDNNTGLRRTEVIMNVSGGLEGIVAFLKDLESGSKYVVRINNFDFLKEGETFRMSLTGTVFSL